MIWQTGKVNREGFSGGNKTKGDQQVLNLRPGYQLLKRKYTQDITPRHQQPACKDIQTELRVQKNVVGQLGLKNKFQA